LHAVKKSIKHAAAVVLLESFLVQSHCWTDLASTDPTAFGTRWNMLTYNIQDGRLTREAPAPQNQAEPLDELPTKRLIYK